MEMLQAFMTSVVAERQRPGGAGELCRAGPAWHVLYLLALFRGAVGVCCPEPTLQAGGEILLAPAAAEVGRDGRVSPGRWELRQRASQHHQRAHAELQPQPR